MAEVRALQGERFGGKGSLCNAGMDSAQLRKHCRLDREGDSLLRSAVERFGFSARGIHRVLKMARTIADMGGEADIGPDHVAEAVQYRTLDRPLN